MYIKMKTEGNEELMDKCKATTREALECVDYFISDALDVRI